MATKVKYIRQQPLRVRMQRVAVSPAKPTQHKQLIDTKPKKGGKKA